MCVPRCVCSCVCFLYGSRCMDLHAIFLIVKLSCKRYEGKNDQSKLHLEIAFIKRKLHSRQFFFPKAQIKQLEFCDYYNKHVTCNTGN